MLKNILLAGIAASSFVLSAQPAKAQHNVPTVRLCTGLKGLNYYWVGQEVQKQGRNIINIELVTSKGALDNISKMNNNECDVGIIQSDALNAADQAGNIEISKPLYKEDWHLICNADSGISRITGLNSKTKILLGDNGSGAEVTWTSFVKADPNRYGGVPHDPIGGQRAAAIVEQGRDAACMAVVTGLNSPGIKEINDSAKQSGKLRLIPSDDGDMLRIKDPKGNYIYTDETIPSGTYAGGLQPKSLFGSSVKTVAVTATLAASSTYLDKHNGDYNLFLKAVNNALPGIKAHVEPQ